MKRAKTETTLSETERHRRDFQDHYLSADYQRPLFDTHDIAFAHKQGPAFDQVRAYNAALHVLLSLNFKGRRGAYVAGSISKGMLANALAAKEGPFSVRLDDGTLLRAAHVSDLDETAGGQLFGDLVIPQNRRVQLQMQGFLEGAFGGKPILIPSMLQAAASVAGHAEFDRGAKRRDSAWMQVWTAQIREHIDTIPVFSDWFFSGATSGLEYPEAECIAAGLRPDRRPYADMRFVDLQGRDVPMSELIRRRVEYLLWAADQGDFRVKHEATMLMRAFALAEMAKRGELPRANPVFLKGILDNLPAIEAMRHAMEPVILERVQKRIFPFDTADLAAVFPDFTAQVQQIQSGFAPNGRISTIPPSAEAVTARAELQQQGIYVHRYSLEEMEAGDFAFRELAQLDPAAYLDRTESHLVTRPVRSTGAKLNLVAEDGESLFSRRLASGLNEREFHMINVAVGGMETVSPRQGRSVYIVADTDAQPPQREQVEELPLLHRFFDRRQPVRFSHEFDDIGRMFSQLPDFSMAVGEAVPSPQAALCYRHTLLARDATDFCFVRGRWESSEHGVQDMMLATRMQLGLEAASPADPHFVRVFDDNGHPLTLADRAKAIFHAIEKSLRDKPDAPERREQATVLAQLGAPHRLCRHHTVRDHTFTVLQQNDPNLWLPEQMEWERISPEIFAYDHRAFDAFWEKQAMPLLEENAANIVRLRHLEHMEDFRVIRDRQQAEQELIGSGPSRNASIYRRALKSADA